MSLDDKLNKLKTDMSDIIMMIDQTPQTDVVKNHSNLLEPLIGKFSKILKKSRPDTNNNTENKSRMYPYCYVCKTRLWKDDMRHNVYVGMCWLCGNVNASKKDIKKDLTGKIAIVTGGRVKIGFETAIRLLQNKCTVIITSRFIDDCLERYEKHPDFNNFKDRMFIYQLNMLNGNNIKKFAEYIMTNFPKIDYLINNAAQTIKRPVQFYQHILDKRDTSKKDSELLVHRDDDELLLLDQGSDQLLLGYEKTDLFEIFPKNELDCFGQQIDLRTNNSWMLEAENVSLNELAEVYIINSIGPYMLCTLLKPIMAKPSPGRDYSWIINVTSMEGVFTWDSKPSRHPHTNMAKAALNMFTRTCGQHYIKSNIVMACVDTGWNNHQRPNSYEFTTPVDCADGAARILDPIYRELKHHSVLYKDFEVHSW
jgi:NAD(P)-dependent dehydrogenase (short-subunit alcohol dehydrogenase family)